MAECRIDGLCRQLVTFYGQRIVDQVDATAAIDEHMSHVMRWGKTPTDQRSSPEEIAAKFIRDYGIHRVRFGTGPDQKSAMILANVALKWAATLRGEQPTQNVADLFCSLRSAFGAEYLKRNENGQGRSATNHRSFTSVTSKILWSLRPDKAPIFDRFALSAVNSLSMINAGFSGRLPPPWPKRPGKVEDPTKVRGDCQDYSTFRARHDSLFRIFQPHLAVNPLTGVYQRRAFDKLLWLLGGGVTGADPDPA